VVHRHAPIDTVRRTVTRATRPALIPLRVAASTLPDSLRPAALGEADDADQASAPGCPELDAMRDQLAATPDLQTELATDRAQRATRSAAAYLEARRARLKSELRDLQERSG
jgi:predicted  nucleic acid-binding Zn-ribbon protein